MRTSTPDEREATTEGKIYARAGLLVSGRSVADVARLGPLPGEILTQFADFGHYENAAAYFQQNVSGGDFVREIDATLDRSLPGAAEQGRRLEAIYAEERAKLPRPSPAPVGRVLADEIPSFARLDLMQTDL